MHGNVDQQFIDIPNLVEVMRYHSLLLSNLDESLWEITARTDENEIMAMAHHKLPLWGLQFHPESILTPTGGQMVSNWLNSIIINP